MDGTSPGSPTSLENHQVASEYNNPLPTAAILCIAIGVYVLLMILALVIRWYLKTHQLVDTSCCGKDDKCRSCCTGCCDQVAAKMKALLCCTSCQGCCVTPHRSWCCCDGGCSGLCDGCHARYLTACCACDNCKPESCCCGAEDLLCQCNKCDCACTCQLPECQAINCCCFEIRIKT